MAQHQCSEIENDWYTYHDKISALAHFLNLQDYFIHAKDPVDDVIYYFEKPWKYENEYKRYLEFVAFINRDDAPLELDFDEAGYWEFINWEKEK